MSKTNNKKTLYLHIGFPKTGTTTLQGFLTRNRESLKSYDIYYPKIDYIKEGCPYSDVTMNGSFLVDEHLASVDALQYKEEIFNLNVNSILKSKYNKIVISSEAFSISTKSIANIVKLKDKFNVIVIAYPRKSIELIASHYQTDIRSGQHFDSFDDYCRMSFLPTCYNNLFELSKIFGRENIIVRPYEREQLMNNCVLWDFMSIIGVKDISEFATQTDANISLNCYDTEFINILNLLPRDPVEKGVIPWSVAPYSQIFKDRDFNKSPSIINTLSEEQIHTICKQYDDIESKVAKIFLNKDALFLNDKYSSYNESNYIEFKDFTNKQVLEYMLIYIDHRFSTQSESTKKINNTWLKKLRRSILQIRYSKNEKLIKLFGVNLYQKRG